MHVDTGPQPIETERLLLRRSRPEDAATISAYRSDPNVNRQQGWDRTDLEGVLADIVEIGRRLWVRGFVASNDGNISVRLGPDRLLMTPASVSSNDVPLSRKMPLTCANVSSNAGKKKAVKRSVTSSLLMAVLRG
mgnify:CR=1 FL=1